MPLDNDTILQERARRLARPIVDGSQDKTIEVVSFSIGAEKFIVESRYVHEIGKLREYTPVPDTPSFVIGVTNIRGVILAVIDLAKFFTIPSRGITDLPRLIVLGEEQFEFGILAAEAHDTYALEESAILEIPESVSSATRKYLRGITADAYLFIDVRTLIDDERLTINQ
jgi:purine-binding chemotaxis protein CheW